MNPPSLIALLPILLTGNRAAAAPCQLSLPLSAALVGVVAGQVDCSQTVDWGIRAGAALLGFQKPVPYVRTSTTVALPASSTSERTDTLQKKWQMLQTLRYVYLPADSLQDLQATPSDSHLRSHAPQQWSALLDSDVSFELRYRPLEGDSRANCFGIRLWQTLPPAWRTLGALQDTRNADARGVVGTWIFQKNRWSGELGIGRMTASVDRVSASFFYPTFALALDLGEL